MKQLYITALIVVATVSAMAQQPQKHLPAKVTITLTAQQALRLDSAVNYANTTIDSKKASQWYMGAFMPFYQQVQSQIVADSVKTVKPVKK